MAKTDGFTELKKQIKENKLSGLYLLYGQEVYIKENYIKKMTDSIDDCGFPDFNRIVIDGKSMTLSEVDDAIESFPMMSEKKLIIIKDSGIFQKATEEQKEYWVKRLENLPDYVVLIFDEEGADKRGILYKRAAKTGLAAEFNYMSVSDLVTWVSREVMNANLKISKDVAEYFVSVCDEGMSNLKNELDKLLNYCDEQITKTDVDKIVSKAVGIRVFELTDCIMAKDADGALKILFELKTVKESAFKLLYLLSSSFDKMLKCSLLLSGGDNYNDIAAKIGTAPFIAKKYANSARGFGENYLVDRIIEVADIDLAIKSGEIDEWSALEKYVINACEKI